MNNTALAFAATGAAGGLPGPAGRAIPLGLSNAHATNAHATRNPMPAVIQTADTDPPNLAAQLQPHVHCLFQETNLSRSFAWTTCFDAVQPQVEVEHLDWTELALARVDHKALVQLYELAWGVAHLKDPQNIIYLQLGALRRLKGKLEGTTFDDLTQHEQQFLRDAWDPNHLPFIYKMLDLLHLPDSMTDPLGGI